MKAPLFRRAVSAFTLIELLVSIAIVALLAALIFPVATQMQAAGMNAACQQNLQQLGAATHLYLADNDDVMLEQDSYAPNYWAWFTYLQPYLGNRVKDRVSLSCPAASALPAPTYTGYGFNGNLDGLKATRFPSFSNVPLAWDDVQIDPSISYNNYAGGWPYSQWAGGGSWYEFAFRHSGKCNLLFLDGHVESIVKGPYGNAQDYPQYSWGPF
jgi:prepilin-type processing-associated H-X9-DG protein/prepilin-type N-terminal cleavage/methylation domain-containing protein